MITAHREPQAWASVQQAIADYLEVIGHELDWRTVDWHAADDHTQNWLDDLKGALVGALENAIDNKAEQHRSSGGQS